MHSDPTGDRKKAPDVSTQQSMNPLRWFGGVGQKSLHLLLNETPDGCLQSRFSYGMKGSREGMTTWRAAYEISEDR